MGCFTESFIKTIKNPNYGVKLESVVLFFKISNRKCVIWALLEINRALSLLGHCPRASASQWLDVMVLLKSVSPLADKQNNGSRCLNGYQISSSSKVVSVFFPVQLDKVLMNHAFGYWTILVGMQPEALKQWHMECYALHVWHSSHFSSCYLDWFYKTVTFYWVGDCG